MPGDTANEQREYVLTVLRKGGAKEAETLVDKLTSRFPELDEEKAGNLIWELIDTHALRVTDEAELEVTDAVAS